MAGCSEAKCERLLTLPRILVNRPEMSLRDELTAVLVTDWFVELERVSNPP